MSHGIKIWKLSLLLLFGLYVLIYVVSSTVYNIYSLKNDPVLGVSYAFDHKASKVYINYLVPGGPAANAGIRNDDYVLRINNVLVKNLEDHKVAYESIRVGQLVEVLIERAGEQQWVRFTAGSGFHVYTNTIFLGLLPGVMFCYSLFLIGLFVLLKKIEDRTAHIFFLMVLFWALAMWDAFFEENAIFNILPEWFRWLAACHWPIAVGLLLHFTLIFPVEKQVFRKYPVAFAFLLYGSLLLMIPAIYGHHNNLTWTRHLHSYGWNIWFTLNFYLSMQSLGHVRKSSNDPHIVKQAGIMMAGTICTLLIPLGLFFLPKNLLGLKVPQAVLLPVVLWPITLSYAIVKHRFMNINFIVKRGVAYAILSGFVIAAYFIFVVGLGKLILVITGSNSQFFTIIATLAIAAVFNPVKNRIQTFVDKRFFPSRYTYREAIRAFGHQLVNVVDLETLQTMVKNFLVENLSIRPVVLLWRAKSEEPFHVLDVDGLPAQRDISIDRDDFIVRELHKSSQLLDLSPFKHAAEAESEHVLKPWKRLQPEILLPLLSKSQLRGVVVLGPKSDGDSYYKEDIELLQTLSDQINTTLTNALLAEELREQERLKKELEVARRIQLSTLPQRDPVVAGLDISGISVPAYEVGGDYYDYLYFADGRFGVVVGDVSGKGTSAALYMSQLKGILNTAAKFYRSLKELMTEVNRITFDSLEEQSYITLTCGAFDTKSCKFSLVRAGHLPLIYFSKKDGKCREIEPKGIGIGLEGGGVFAQEIEEVQFRFSAGDAFVFYSDGLTEARNCDGLEFMTEEMVQCIEANGVATASELREKILTCVNEFAGGIPQVDDMTLVVVKAA